MVFICDGRLSWNEATQMPPLLRRAFAYTKRIQRGEHLDWDSGIWLNLPPGAKIKNA